MAPLCPNHTPTAPQAVPALVQETFDKVAQLTGRQYKLFDYVGHPEVRGWPAGLGSLIAALPRSLYAAALS